MPVAPLRFSCRRMIGPSDHVLVNGGQYGETYIGHPHGNYVRAVLGTRRIPAAAAYGIDGNGIPSTAIQDGGKIVFHNKNALSFRFL